MSASSVPLVRSLEQAMKLPRENGELAFKTQWEGRVFAMAVLLMQQGRYPWQEFNGKFVAEIGAAEREHPDVDTATVYYRHWIRALEKLLLEKGMLTGEQLEIRTGEFGTGQRNHVC
jgi:nitrile hydratase accessory protein